MLVLTAMVLAGLIVGFLASWGLMKVQFDKVNKKLTVISDYITPGCRVYVADEDADPEVLLTPSPLEQTFLKAAGFNNRGPMARTRLLVDVKLSDLQLRKHLLTLREKGDGQWLAVALERMLKDRALNRELLQLKRQVVPNGWNLAAIEPAYDSGDGLFVWFEIERPVADFKSEESESRAA